VDVLRRDLHSLVSRFDVPGGFVDSVRLFIEAEVVSATSDHFLRPMRLTVSELCALELGLAITRAARPPDEHAVLDRARARLRDVIARLPSDPVPDALHGASLGDQGDTAQLAAVRTGLRERRKLRLTYRKSGSTTADERMVCPYGLVQSSGMLYLVAWYEEGQGVRIFRLDRMERVEVTTDSFATPDGFSIDAVLSDGRALQRQEADSMRVWYSPRVAPWIAEREGRSLAADGSLVLDHPLVDREWGLRHVLQYGAEAEVLEPEDMRERVRERLGILSTLVVSGS
jgi:proteasome accessory factor C